MSDTLQILDKLNSFYSSSFSQLVTFTVGLLAFVGVLLPLFVALLQARSAKRDQEALSKEIEAAVALATKQMGEVLAERANKAEAGVRKLVEQSKDEIAKEIKKLRAASEARTTHLQAVSHMDKKAYGLAAEEALEGIELYAQCGEEQNISACMHIAIESLAQLRDISFEDGRIEAQSGRTVKALVALNANGRYTRDIDKVQTQLAAAKKRKAGPTPGAPTPNE